MRKNGKNISTQPGQDNFEDSPESRESFPESEGTPRPRFLEMQGALNSNRQRLLRQIIDESSETYHLSSREMARRYEVDSATIIRTVQALGYKKYADFARDLREHFVTQITPYSAMKAATQTNQSVEDLVMQNVSKDVENLASFRAYLDPAKIIEFAQQINHSRRIIVIGIDFAAGLAASLAYGLVRLGFDAEAPIGSTGVVQNKIRILSQQDLIIAISFGRGLRETIEAVKRGRQQNVPTIGITDGDTTPIAQYCDAYLVASTAHTSFIDSYVAPVAALNALLVACAHSQSSRSLKILGESEAANTSSTRWYREAKFDD